MASSSNVEAAVSFLRDPAVQDAPLNKKLEFLKAKGLSQSEIDEAFRIAANAGPSGSTSSSSSSSSGPVLPPRQGGYGYPGYAQAGPYPPLQDGMRPDWRDWFIMAVVGGGVGTLMYSLARVSALSLLYTTHSLYHKLTWCI